MSAVQKDDQEAEDTLTTEEELFLKHKTMRDFFLQELKALREAVSSGQKAAQDDLKAFTEVTEMNFMEELQRNAERTHRQLQCDLQMLEENSKTALQKVEVQVKAMEESVLNRMVTLEGKLEAVVSRLTAIEADVCNMLLSPGATFNLTRRAASLSSASSPLLSSMPLQEAESSNEFEIPTLVDSVTSGYRKQVTWTKRKLAESLGGTRLSLSTKQHY